MLAALAPLLLALNGAPALPAAAAPQRSIDGGEVVLEVHDADGRRLGWDAFRRRQDNGHGEKGHNDVLLDPHDLTVIESGPLYSSNAQGNGDPALQWPGRPAALALAWPTSLGYSNLIVDLPGPGRYDLGLLAARQAAERLERLLDARPGYRPSALFEREHARVQALLDKAQTAAADRGLGMRALDTAAEATLLLLTESGLQCARARAPGELQWGFTLDTVEDAERALTSVAELAPGDGWVRLVFDRIEPPRTYRTAVEVAHHLGVRVVGQILDSSQMKDVSPPAWRERVRRYVDALPDVDEWEVGNEVNGTWLGPDVVAKVAYAARYVRAHTRARTLLTLHWQLGEDQPRSSMFEWSARHLSPQLLRDIDDIGISLYPEDNPMGLALDRVLETLHARFSAQRVLISELGYWSPDLGHLWWWGSADRPQDTGRVAVARLYGSAILGYPYAAGGTYWWYYRQDALEATSLRREFAALHARAAGARHGG